MDARIALTGNLFMKEQIPYKGCALPTELYPQSAGPARIHALRGPRLAISKLLMSIPWQRRPEEGNKKAPANPLSGLSRGFDASGCEES